jgi:hypothetical protein
VAAIVVFHRLKPVATKSSRLKPATGQNFWETLWLVLSRRYRFRDGDGSWR